MSEEDCGICGLELSEKFSYELNCKHVFHYECLMKSFNNTSYNKKCSNICPYCRSNSPHLPLINGLKKVIPGVHCGISSYEIEPLKKELLFLLKNYDSVLDKSQKDFTRNRSILFGNQMKSDFSKFILN